jgi:hypothetical protein
MGRRPSPIVAVAAVALAAGAGGVAVAQSGGSTIFACSNNLRESIRFVGEGVACAAGETLVTWGQQGPAGPPGEPGRVTFDQPPAVDATLARANRSFAVRAKKLPKKRIAQLKAADSEPGEARAAYRDGPVALPSSLAAFLGLTQGQPPPVVASLPLPAGRWVVSAKANASLDYNPQMAVAAAGDTFDVVGCQLRAGVDTDVSGVEGFSGALAMQVVHRYTTPGLVQLECWGLLQPTLHAIKLTAIRVSKFTNQAVGG